MICKFNLKMEFYLDDEFEFAIEMIILSRNDNGATLSEIHGNLFIQILLNLTVSPHGDEQYTI